MLFKRFLFSALFCFIVFGSYAQSPFQIELKVTGRNAAVNAIKVGDIVLFLERRGDVRFEAEDDNDIKLDYYDRFDNDNLGKLKSIGSLGIKYYDRFDHDELHGKVKSIGSVQFTYYDVFDPEELRGKLKSIGGLSVKYYDKFDLSELTGKLKSVGETSISYYDRFDSRGKAGRVKAIKGNTPQIRVLLSDKLSDDVEVSR